jgi:hypothetical protein
MPFTMTMNLFGNERYHPKHPEYLRLAEAAAKLAIAQWLEGIDPNCMHFFKVDGIECAVECFSWGMSAPRWRWGRLDAGDPDEDESGEDILLDVALGRRISPSIPKVRRRKAKLPPYADGDLAEDEIKACAMARAKENLGKLVLHPSG